MNVNSDERERLSELFDELERVRTGRSVRRRSTVAGAALVLIIATGVLLVSGSASTTTTPARETPVAADLSEPLYTSIEIVESSAVPSRIETVTTTESYRHVEFVDDEGLARSLREMGIEGGVARVGGPGGRVILTGSLAKSKDSDERPGPGAM